MINVGGFIKLIGGSSLESEGGPLDLSAQSVGTTGNSVRQVGDSGGARSGELVIV